MTSVLEAMVLVCLIVGIGVAIGAAFFGSVDGFVIGILLIAIAAVGLAVFLWHEDP